MLETTLAPLDLLRLTQEVERELGRTAKTDSVYHDRLIDIDLLLYGEEVIDQPGLQIPHPLMHRRAFVMTPMAEIAPEVVHPVLGKTMKALSDLLESENAG
jgi:2-amino-4-hydroxy-6-hydroxymethyldihydropteridine diphosphokinase